MNVLDKLCNDNGKSKVRIATEAVGCGVLGSGAMVAGKTIWDKAWQLNNKYAALSMALAGGACMLVGGASLEIAGLKTIFNFIPDKW